MRARLRLFAWIWAGWTALALFFAISLYLNYIARNQPARFGASLIISLAEWWLWAPLTPVVIGLARRFPLQKGRRGRDVAIHLAAAAILSTAKVLGERFVRLWIFGVAPYLLPSSLALHFLVYWAIAGAARGFEYYRESQLKLLRASQTEARLNEARLELLRAQLQPHFLFNALNTVAEMVHEDADRADRMIASLSDLLRVSLDSGDAVPLAEEMRIAGLYLDIQQARFGDRLRVRWDIPDTCATTSVPRLLLQPLLENAIQHGLSQARGGGTIEITARDRPALSEPGNARVEGAGTLIIRISDDGTGVATPTKPDGIGLANTRARLAAWAPDAKLELRPRPGGGTLVQIDLPERTV
jgi:two-component system LytT family sensor kinase